MRDLLQPVNCKTRREAMWLGAREAAGIPAIIMSASFVGFGSMIHSAGWEPLHGAVSTVSTWALPGQVMMIEMYASGAPLLAIAISVGLVNARLFPMVVSLLPAIRRGDGNKWYYYLMANMMALTSWVGTMTRIPYLKPDHRLSYFTGFAGLLFFLSPVFTLVGFYVSDMVPRAVSIGLVFLNPLYFGLLFLIDLKKPGKIIALVLGAILGPITFMVSSDWSLLLTGLLGGTAAYFMSQRLEDPDGADTPEKNEEGTGP